MVVLLVEVEVGAATDVVVDDDWERDLGDVVEPLHLEVVAQDRYDGCHEL